MATPTNLFEELKKALETFKKFLGDNLETMKKVVKALKSMVPIVDLLDKLIVLMGKLKDEIDKIDPGKLGEGLDKVSELAGAVKALLEVSQGLLPNEAATIDEALKLVTVVGSLPSFKDLKDTILGLIKDVTGYLGELKTAATSS